MLPPDAVHVTAVVVALVTLAEYSTVLPGFAVVVEGDQQDESRHVCAPGR